MEVRRISKAVSLSLACTIASLALAACQSKFGDSEPTPSGSTGFTVNTRLNANEDLDKKLDRIDQGASKIRSFLDKYRQIEKARSGADVYTQLDFMLDLNQELKKAPAENDNGKYVKYGKFEIKLKGVPEACRVVETKIETRGTEVAVGPIPGDIGLTDALLLSVKTCKTSGQFRQIGAIEFTETTTTFKFDNEALSTSLEDILLPSLKVATNCEINMNPSTHILSSVVCENLVTRISASEYAVLDKVSYTPYEEIRLLLDGGLFENNVKKALIHLSLDKNNKPSFSVDQINPQPAVK